MKNKFWSTFGQVLIGTVASYGMAKCENPKEGWVEYRDRLQAQTAQLAMGYIMERQNPQK